MENYVTSLELSRRLDALIKDKKGTEFYWRETFRPHGVGRTVEVAKGIHCYGKICRSFLTDEIMERLPKNIKFEGKDTRFEMVHNDSNGWVISYVVQFTEDIPWQTHHKSLPEACGLMLEYLLVNHLI